MKNFGFRPAAPDGKTSIAALKTAARRSSKDRRLPMDDHGRHGGPAAMMWASGASAASSRLTSQAKNAK
eukprot:5548841-Alexandrium_andersonii.AAC.1